MANELFMGMTREEIEEQLAAYDALNAELANRCNWDKFDQIVPERLHESFILGYIGHAEIECMYPEVYM